jgi:hypothetical protein
MPRLATKKQLRSELTSGEPGGAPDVVVDAVGAALWCRGLRRTNHPTETATEGYACVLCVRATRQRRPAAQVGMHYAASLAHKAQMGVQLETDSPEAINECLRCVRKGGRVSVVGAYAGGAAAGLGPLFEGVGLGGRFGLPWLCLHSGLLFIAWRHCSAVDVLSTRRSGLCQAGRIALRVGAQLPACCWEAGNPL